MKVPRWQTALAGKDRGPLFMRPLPVCSSCMQCVNLECRFCRACAPRTGHSAANVGCGAVAGPGRRSQCLPGAVDRHAGQEHLERFKQNLLHPPTPRKAGGGAGRHGLGGWVLVFAGEVASTASRGAGLRGALCTVPVRACSFRNCLTSTVGDWRTQGSACTRLRHRTPGTAAALPKSCWVAVLGQLRPGVQQQVGAQNTGGGGDEWNGPDRRGGMGMLGRPG